MEPQGWCDQYDLGREGTRRIAKGMESRMTGSQPKNNAEVRLDHFPKEAFALIVEKIHPSKQGKL
jgi:hypothetical protein